MPDLGYMLIDEDIIPPRERELMLRNVRRGVKLDIDDLEMITDYVLEYTIENDLRTYSYYLLDMNNVKVKALGREKHHIEDMVIPENNDIIIAIPSDLSYKY